MNTPRQSIEKISHGKLLQDIGTIKQVDVLGRDTNGDVTAISPSVIVQLHTMGGLARAEMPRGWDLTTIAIGDDVVVISDLYGRWLITQVYASSNRTQAGMGSHGFGSGLSHLGRPRNLAAKIAGSQLELTWTPVRGAILYQIWQSISASPLTDDQTPASNAASIIGQTATSSWVSNVSGSYFDDGYYYAVAAMDRHGRQSALSAWVQPTFVGSPTYGLVSKDQPTVIPGSLVVCKSGSITRADFTSVDSPTTFTIDVCDPLGTHPVAAPFSNSDILRFVDVSGNALWVTISSSSDQTTFWRYTVTKSSPAAGTNRTIKSGSAVENWGQSGQGIFLLSADSTFGAGTLWAIVTHAGAPWTTTTTQVSANSAGQILGAAGNIILDATSLKLKNGTFFQFLHGSDVIGDLASGWGPSGASGVAYTQLRGIGVSDSPTGRVIFEARDSAGTQVLQAILDASATATRVILLDSAGTFQGMVIGSTTYVTPAAMLDVYGGGEFDGHVVWRTDNTYDIGASGATRPRDLFLGRNAVIGGTLSLGGNVISNLLFTDNTYDIGASGATRPRDIYLARDAYVAGVYKVGATQVVTARQTGYAAMTGTPDRGTTYDTATVTLPQLAGRLMAIQADLTTHGLIGA